MFNYDKIMKRIENGELVSVYYSERYRKLTFVFTNSPVVVRTNNRKLKKMYMNQVAY